MYQAIIVKVSNLRPHSNADRLQLCTILGSQVIVGLETKEGELGVYFPEDGQISEEYAAANNLIGYKDPTTGEKKGGMFDSKRRVRTQKLRGEKSEGFFMPLSSLSFTGTNTHALYEGDTFTSLMGIPICNKYYSPATLRVLKNNKNNGERKAKRGTTLWFPQHVKDTTQFRWVDTNIPYPSLIHFTEKLHGTQGRYGYVLDTQEIPPSYWVKQVFKFLQFCKFTKGYVPDTFTGYTYLNGSKKVILEKSEGKGYYGTQDFRYKAIENISLKKGEIIFGEIIGWVNRDVPIMPSQNITKYKDLAHLIPFYGDTMHYTYGLERGDVKFYVYRMLHMGEDGHYVDMDWGNVVKRCEELNIPIVPHLETYYYTGNLEELREKTENHCIGPSLLAPTNMREGVVLRVEDRGERMFVKHKSFEFKLLEGIIKEDDSQVNIEEIEDISMGQAIEELIWR